MTAVPRVSVVGEVPGYVPPPPLPPLETTLIPLVTFETSRVDVEGLPETISVVAEGPPAAPPPVELAPPPRLPPFEAPLTPLAMFDTINVDVVAVPEVIVVAEELAPEPPGDPPAAPVVRETRPPARPRVLIVTAPPAPLETM